MTTTDKAGPGQSQETKTPSGLPLGVRDQTVCCFLGSTWTGSWDWEQSQGSNPGTLICTVGLLSIVSTVMPKAILMASSDLSLLSPQWSLAAALLLHSDDTGTPSSHWWLPQPPASDITDNNFKCPMNKQAQGKSWAQWAVTEASSPVGEKEEGKGIPEGGRRNWHFLSIPWPPGATLNP